MEITLAVGGMASSKMRTCGACLVAAARMARTFFLAASRVRWLVDEGYINAFLFGMAEGSSAGWAPMSEGLVFAWVSARVASLA